MPRQDSDKAPFTFQDIADLFSEEEWKLLHEWQKELYQNVMFEINQALTSLGPLIAASVFSLRAREKEDMYPLDSEDSEGRSCVNLCKGERISNADVYCRVNSKECLQLKDPQPVGGREGSGCLNTEEESGASWTEHAGSDEEPSSVNPSSCSEFPFVRTEFPMRKEEESADYLLNEHGTTVEEHCIDLCTGNAIIASVVSFNIKEEDKRITEDHEFKGRENTTESAGGGIHRRRRKDRNPLTSAGLATQCRSSGKIKADVLQKPDVKTISVSRMWTGSNQEIGGMETAHCENDISNAIHSNAYPEATEAELIMADASSGYEYNVNKEKSLACQTTTQQDWRPRTFEDCEVTLSERGIVYRDQTEEMSDGLHVYPDHKKSPSLKQCQNEHQRKNSEQRYPTVKPYVCNECAKSFSIKGSLLRHQKAHAGVRYACTECDKSFTQKGDLTIHQRTHAGKNPYTCTYCQKSFSSKCNLNQHKRKHFGQYVQHFPKML